MPGTPHPDIAMRNALPRRSRRRTRSAGFAHQQQRQPRRLPEPQRSLPGTSHPDRKSGSTPASARIRIAETRSDPVAPPIAERRQARPIGVANHRQRTAAAQRPTNRHSRQRPAGRAACARACGPAAALTPGRASVQRGKPGRATPGGSAGAASVRTTDPRVPLDHQRLPMSPVRLPTALRRTMPDLS
jgi:hypothetical protein